MDLAVTEAQNTGGAGTDVLTGIERLIGSDFGDTLAGNNKSNRIDGGAGADTMTGGTGNDTYVVDNAGDTVMEDANSGSDVIESSVSYVLPDNIERLHLTGTEDIDATGNDGNNELKGNDGDNRLDGGAGRDTMYGGLGDDTYVVDDRYDRVIESKNAGTDVVRSAVHYTLASTLEHLELTGTDHIRGTGNSLGNRLTGNFGNNRLSSKQGDDTLLGGGGDDTLEGGSGDDLYVISGGLANHTVITEYRGLDTLRFDGVVPFVEVTGVERVNDHLVLTFQAGGSLTLHKFFRGLPVETLEAWGLPFDMPTDFDGNASLASYLGVDVGTATAGDDVIVGDNVDNDDIHGQGGNDRIAGVGGDDTLTGDEGADTLSGGAGDDSLVGGPGADSIDGGDGDDTASYIDSDASVGVNLKDGVGSGGHAGGDTLINIENIVGSNHGDTLAGDGRDNVLDGGDGDDVLNGGAGADSLVGGHGSDTSSYAGSDAAVNVDLETGINGGGHAEGDTLSGVENLIGSDHGDTLTGDGGDNMLDGGDGNDVLTGGAGADSLLGSDGDDTASYSGSDAAVNIDLQTATLSGGHAEGDTLNGIEHLTGSDHNDTLTGDSGGNTLEAGAGADLLTGGTGADSLIGGDGDDTASYAASNAGIDVNLDTGTSSGGHAEGDTLTGIENLIGSDHGDTLSGDTGDNTLDGGDGDDFLVGGDGADSLIGGDGNDTASFAGSGSAVTVNLQTGDASGGHSEGDILSGIENLIGSDHDDTLSGDTGSNTLDGGDGNDLLSGGSGSDSLVGGAGNDTASYDSSDTGIDVELATGAGSGGDASGDTLYGIENLIGSDHGDTLSGDSGDNTLEGGNGDDVLTGGSGSDSLDGGGGSDTVSYAGSDAAVEVNLHSGTLSGGHAAGDTLSGIENLTGSDHSDTLTGDTADNVLDGGAGDDWLGGGSSGDWLIGGNGADTLVGGLGNDTLTGGAGNDRFVFSDSLGDEHITDFGDGDRIDFSFALVAHYEALDTNNNGVLDDADANITVFDGNTVISLVGGQITVENETSLDASDFHYF